MSEALRSSYPIDRLSYAGHHLARELCRRNDLAMPEAHIVGWRRHERINWCSRVSSNRMAGRRDACFSGSGELLRGAFYAHRQSRALSLPCTHILSDAVSDPYTGPGRGGLNLTLAIYPAHHRFIRRVIDIVLRTLDPFLIFQRETLIFLRQGPELFTPGSPRTHVCEKGLNVHVAMTRATSLQRRLTSKSAKW